MMAITAAPRFKPEIRTNQARSTGVQVTETAIGTNTSIQTAIPNVGSGIRISGRVHGNAVGGFQPSIEPQVAISSNGGDGIEIVGAAQDNRVVHTCIGTNAEDTGARQSARWKLPRPGHMVQHDRWDVRRRSEHDQEQPANGVRIQLSFTRRTNPPPASGVSSRRPRCWRC